MKNILKLLFVLTLSIWFTFWNLDHFFVQVNPNSLTPNEPADLVIKALDEESNVIKDFGTDWNWTILISVEWDAVENDYITPNWWVYEFETDDNWEKTFSKWLIFKKEWKFKIIVYSFGDENLKWEAEISVKLGLDSNSWSEIEVLSPIQWSIEKSTSIKINATSYSPNSPYELYLDDTKVKDWIWDENWWINTSIDDLETWEHSIIIKLTDIDWKVISESKAISFTIQWESSELLKSFTFLPSQNLNKNDKWIVNIEVSEDVVSAELIIKNMWNYPMEMEKDKKWYFRKEILFDKNWTFEISVKLISSSITKEFPKQTIVNVTEKPWIKEVKIIKDENNNINLEWTYVWDIKKFKVSYWTWKDASQTWTSLIWTIFTDVANASILNSDQLNTYFIKVYPIDSNWNIFWKESELLILEPNMKSAWSCTIKWIKLNTKKEWDKYYLTWDKIESVNKYIIYKSDNLVTDIKSMQKVWETQETKFEYPFDPKKVSYAYYSVEAECSDWELAQIDWIKKVQVGPYDNIILIVLISWFLYLIYRLYNFVK